MKKQPRCAIKLVLLLLCRKCASKSCQIACQRSVIKERKGSLESALSTSKNASKERGLDWTCNVTDDFKSTVLLPSG